MSAAHCTASQSSGVVGGGDAEGGLNKLTLYLFVSTWFLVLLVLCRKRNLAGKKTVNFSVIFNRVKGVGHIWVSRAVPTVSCPCRSYIGLVMSRRETEDGRSRNGPMLLHQMYNSYIKYI